MTQDIKECWNENYYEHAGKASEKIEDNPGLARFKQLAAQSQKVLECGCGEGTKLFLISGDCDKSYGVDISDDGISIAQKRYPNTNFQVGSIDKLSFEDGFFDFVYTAFVMEHTFEPEKIIDEMIRVTHKGGYIGIQCPNFGSICYKSPCSKENIIFRSIKKILKHYFMFLFPKNSLYRKKVEPIATPEKWESDWDTTIEPDMVSTLHYLSGFDNVEILEKSSLWEVANPHNAGKLIVMLQKMCWWLGERGVYPFKYYGPQLFILLKKK